MVSLDTLNIIKLNAKVIEAGTVTADKMNVTELSAITANLGTITAGLLQAVTIIGSLIQTKEAGNYPRVELSSTNDLLTAQASATKYIEIVADLLGNPVVRVSDGSYFTNISQSGNSTTFGGNGIVSLIALGVLSGDVLIYSERGDVDIVSPLGNVNINGTSFSSVLSTLAGKANSFTGYTGSHNGGTYANGILVSVP